MEGRPIRNTFAVCLLLCVVLVGCETGVPPEEVATVYYNLGNAYFELEEYSQAATAYLNALKLDDTLPQAGYNLARVYIESGDYEKGLTALNNLLEEDPGNSLILSTIGWTYYLSANYEKALETFETILERVPTDEHALYNAAVLSVKLDRKEAALGYYQRLYKENGDSEVLYRIASLYVELEQWPEAVSALDEYLAEKPDDATAYYDLGIAYAAEHYYGEALDKFDAGAKLKPADPRYNFEKAVILLLYIENLDEGLKALKAAVKAGFKDEERISELLGSDELIYKDEVKRFFEENGLLPEEAPAVGDGTEGSAGSEAGNTAPPDGAEDASPAPETGTGPH